MNGSIQPTVELATNNGAYPVMPYSFNNGLFGNGDNSIWAIVLIALLFGNGGFGFGGNNQVATTDYISNEFTQRDVNNGFQNTNNLISNGFSNSATNLCNVRSDILTGNMGIQNSILDSKYASAMGDANTQRDVLIQTTQLENQLSQVALSNQAHLDSCCCQLRAQGLENTQKILDALNQNTIQDLRDKLATANNQLSDQSVINAVRPYPIPSYLVSSPYSSIYNGFYGNGFYGNAII